MTFVSGNLCVPARRVGTEGDGRSFRKWRRESLSRTSAPPVVASSVGGKRRAAEPSAAAESRARVVRARPLVGCERAPVLAMRVEEGDAAGVGVASSHGHAWILSPSGVST